MSLDLRSRSLLLIAFFLSGAASLIFEVIWTRLLLISLGATAIAVGVVLGAFMGGMAVGSALAGREFLSRRDPILTYAVLEGWVGLYGLATPFLLRLLTGTPPTLQFLMAVIVLLPSTIAMGASLPMLSRAFGRGSELPAVQVGNLYAANTAGAVAGPLLAVFWLFPAFGLSRCLHIAAIVNLVVFAGLVWSRKAFPPWEGDAPTLSTPTEDTKQDRPNIWLLIAMGVSGATAMVYYGLQSPWAAGLESQIVNAVGVLPISSEQQDRSVGPGTLTRGNIRGEDEQAGRQTIIGWRRAAPDRRCAVRVHVCIPQPRWCH